VSSPVTGSRKVSSCAIRLGFVVYDVVCLAIGGVALRAGASEEAAEAVANAAEPVLSKIETIVAQMASDGASPTDLAKGVWSILKTIWSGGCGGAVLSAFLSSLPWYYALLYGASAMATIVAALATDGVAFIAEVVIELASAGFLLIDCVKATTTCTLQPLNIAAAAAAATAAAAAAAADEDDDDADDANY